MSRTESRQKSITPEKCAEFRDLVKGTELGPEQIAAGEPWHRTSVNYHAYGHCSHGEGYRDHPEPARTDLKPRLADRPHGELADRVCSVIRERLARNYGDTITVAPYDDNFASEGGKPVGTALRTVRDRDNGLEFRLVNPGARKATWRVREVSADE